MRISRRTGKPSKLLTLELINNGTLYFFREIQDIKLGDINSIMAIDETEMLENNQVGSTTTSSSTCCGTKFFTNFLEVLPSLLIDVTKGYVL